MEQVRISAKNLGAMALPDFCPRCFCLKPHARQLPFQNFLRMPDAIGQAKHTPAN